jgi:4'-phosphopantetheinyl transferase
MPHVAYLDITSAAAARLEAGHARAEDHSFALRSRNERGQRQRLLVRALLRAELARHYPAPAAVWQILRDESGAPRLADAGGTSPPYISLSHSGDRVACAISAEDPIGVDIESIRADRPVAALAEAAFGPVEAAAVARIGSAEFYRLWTLREALAKATGAGFGLLVNRVDLVPPESEAPERRQCFDGRDWRFRYWLLAGQYGIGLVTSAVDLPVVTSW